MSKARNPRAIDQIRAKQKNLRSKEHVPEWELDIYFPPSTYETRTLVAQEMGDKPEGVSAEAWLRRSWVVEFVIVAEHEDGEKMFLLSDVDMLMSTASAPIMDRLIEKMFTAGLPDAPQTVAEGKADSETTQNSEVSSS